MDDYDFNRVRRVEMKPFSTTANMVFLARHTVTNREDAPLLHDCRVAEMFLSDRRARLDQVSSGQPEDVVLHCSGEANEHDRVFVRVGDR